MWWPDSPRLCASIHRLATVFALCLIAYVVLERAKCVSHYLLDLPALFTVSLFVCHPERSGAKSRDLSEYLQVASRISL